MRHNQPKKLVNPSNVTVFKTPVLGFFTDNVWESFGIVWKNFSISLNCSEVKPSTNSTSSFLVQSAAAHASSALKTVSIHDAIILNDLSMLL